MRLIDADALKGKVLRWMPSDPCGIEEKEFPIETDIVASLMMEIEVAPTIKENRPQGEWIEYWRSADDGTEYRWEKCSQCGQDMIAVETNYCPNCGADMTIKD